MALISYLCIEKLIMFKSFATSCNKLDIELCVEDRLFY